MIQHHNSCRSEHPPEKIIHLDDVQSAGVLVATLHANRSIPKSVSSEVVLGINEISELSELYRKQEIGSTLADAENMPHDVAN